MLSPVLKITFRAERRFKMAYVYLEACELCGELRILTLVAYSK